MPMPPGLSTVPAELSRVPKMSELVPDLVVTPGDEVAPADGGHGARRLVVRRSRDGDPGAFRTPPPRFTREPRMSTDVPDRRSVHVTRNVPPFARDGRVGLVAGARSRRPRRSGWWPHRRADRGAVDVDDCCSSLGGHARRRASPSRSRRRVGCADRGRRAVATPAGRGRSGAGDPGAVDVGRRAAATVLPHDQPDGAVRPSDRDVLDAGSGRDRGAAGFATTPVVDTVVL